MGVFVFRLGVVAMFVFVTSIELKDGPPAPAEAKVKCPQSLSGCTCEHLPNGTFHLGITCTDIANSQDFKTNLDAMAGTKLDTLTLSGLRFWPWPKNAFLNQYTEFIYIDQCFVSKLYGPDKLPLFNGLSTSLKYLEFNRVNLTKFSWWRLKDLKSLKFLKVTETPIRKLWKSIAKVGGGNLTSITFIENKMKKIQNHALVRMTNVAEILIEQNRLRIVKRTMFPNPANSLIIFSLAGNEIQSIPADMFKGMPKLTFLNLKNNQLQVLSSETFTPIIPQLKLLTISGNPFNCDCNLQGFIKAMDGYEEAEDMLTSYCKTPEKLHNQTLDSLTEENLTC